MNKKSFFLGVATGIVLTLATLFVIAFINHNLEDNDPVQYLEKPVSYENKKETSFKVLQVLGNAALATEASDKIGSDVFYYGNTVLVLGRWSQHCWYAYSVVNLDKMNYSISPSITGTVIGIPPLLV